MTGQGGKHKRPPGGAHRGDPRFSPSRQVRRTVVPAGVLVSSVALTVTPANAYLIQRGDTLSEIAATHDTTVARLARLNGIANPDLIYAGDRLRLTAADRVARLRLASAPARSTGGFCTRQRLAMPVSPVTVTQRYHGGHPAIDLAGPTGSAVRAVAPGRVVRAVRSSVSYGNHVEVAHGCGYTTLYAHLNSLDVGPGEAIRGGAVLGTRGSTGNSTGPHLHFEIRRNGVHVDPAGWLR